MASWKDAPGQYLWGTFSNIGNYYKIYAFGGPGGGDSDYFYVPREEMDRLRSKNYGTGIHFWWDGDALKITINLIIVSAKSDYQYVQGDNVRYVGGSDLDYEFLANIQYQTNDGTWHKLGDHSINMHHGGQPLYPASGWDSGSGYLWNTFTIRNVNVDNIKQFSIGIHGALDEVGNWAYYPIEKIKPTTPTPRPQPRPVNRTLTLKYVDRASGRSIKRDTTQSVEDGKLYRLTPAELVGYTAEETSAQIRINGDTVYTFYYTRNVEYANVTVEYIDRATNRKLRSDKTLRNQTVGSRITEYAEDIDNYTVESDTVYHNVVSGSNIIRFYYNRNREYRNVTVEYIDRANNNKLRNDKTLRNKEVGTSITEYAVDIPNYTVEDSSIEHTVATAYNIIRFYYNRNREYRDVTIEYVDTETGRKLRADKVLSRQEVGTNVVAYYIPISGYNVDNDTKTYRVTAGNNVIRFNYSRNIVYIRPWAIRKSGVWKSFTTNSTNMVKRVSGAWSKKDTSMDSRLAGGNKTTNDTAGNKSASYIRKNGSWKRQGKIGS